MAKHPWLELECKFCGHMVADTISRDSMRCAGCGQHGFVGVEAQ